MNVNWRLRHSGTYGGRKVTVSVSDDGDLRVTTTQKTTDPGRVTVGGGQTALPATVFSGDTIDIDAPTPEQLEKELVEAEFTSEEAAEIARHARSPAP